MVTMRGPNQVTTDRDPTRVHFEAARRKAFWNEVGRFLGRPSRELLSWGDVKDNLHVSNLVDAETGSINLDEIVGSVGRYHEFDRAFRPKLDSTAQRWRSVASAYLNHVRLPPVTLYKVGEIYFVVDGHHRISVARELGQAFVDANVIEAEARVPVTTTLDAESLQLAGEYTRFLERTRLDLLRPEQSVEFTTLGAYDWALNHIAQHRRAMSQEQDRPVTQDEAVVDWYDRLYVPVARIIRNMGMLAEFPRRAEADLFLWIVDHQHNLVEQCGTEVSEVGAAEHLAYRYSVQPVKRLMRAAREWVAGPVCSLVVDQELRGQASSLDRGHGRARRKRPSRGKPTLPQSPVVKRSMKRSRNAP